MLDSPPTTILRTKNVGHSFGSVAALRGVSLELRRGSVHALLGRSGCGKSTFVKIAAGIIRPSEGEITVFGTTPEINATSGGVGYLAQEPALMPWLTVEENVALPLTVLARHSSSNFAASSRAIKQALDLMGVNFPTDLYPQQLSGGMQMRCGLARSVVHQPGLLLLDEPFSDLDFILRDDLYKKIRILAQELQMLILVVTHDISEAITVADRIFVFRHTPSTEHNSLRATVEVPIEGARGSDFPITVEFRSCYTQVAAAIAGDET